jgi:hypothetical protein
MNLIQNIKKVVNKEKFDIPTIKEMKECELSNRKAQINPMGQIQFRAAITASGNTPTKIYGTESHTTATNLIEQLGIKYLTDLQANLTYPILNNTSTWADEVTNNYDGNSYTLSGLTLSPKRLVSCALYSKNVLLNSGYELEKEIENDIINDIYETVQETMFNDLYDANSGDSISISGNTDIIDMELSGATNKINNPIYLVSPTAASYLKSMKDGDTLIDQNGMIYGHQVIETPLLNGNKVIYGNFNKLLLGQWGTFDVTVDDVTRAKDGLIRLIINSYFNYGLLDSNSFLYATIS